MIYDAAIIGTGPAGVSAALNLKIHEKALMWFGSRNLSDKASKAEAVNNYPGLPGISGAELNAAFRKHIDAMGLEITDQMVNAILTMGDHYAVSAGPDFYEVRSIILATGVALTATLPGEAERVGRGVSYCATCDGGLYRGRTVAVLCANRRFEHEVAFLAGLAEKVYFFPTYPDSGVSAPNVETMTARIKGLEGDGGVQAVILTNGERLPVDGAFFLRDAIALNALLPKLATEDGHIAVNRAMETNLPGVFAAGDCTGRPYQYAKAVGEGNVAAHSAIEYLARRGSATDPQ